MSAFKVGDVLTYTPDERFDRFSCREGTAIVAERRGGGSHVIADTYWGCGGDAHVLTESELATASVVFNLADYDELDQYAKHSSRATWEKYAPADREVVTSQHQLEVRWFIRKGATEDHATKVAKARERLGEAESELRSAERAVEWRRQELAQLEAVSA